MTTYLQLHLLTSYPPSNLNRDEDGRPKSAQFGGATRIRVSSQSLKRAWRTSSVFADRVGDHVGKRTQRIGETVHAHLATRGADVTTCNNIARYIGGVFGTLDATKADGERTKQLVFVGPDERAEALRAADELLDGTLKMDTKWQAFLCGSEKKPSKVHPLTTRLLRTVDSATDIAMFGRMLPDVPQFSREAAVQVAHALTTHAAVIEGDFYVALDDLQRSTEDEGLGTSFMGVQEFGAGLFYLYICVDINLLTHNLGGDTKLAHAALAGLVECASTIAPSGKQATFASRARASYVLAERGTQQPRSLAAAFLRAVSADEERGDVTAASISRIEQFCSNLDAVYGPGDTDRMRLVATVDRAEGALSDLVAFAQRGALVFSGSAA